jgi:hypothetical protein
MPCHIHLFVAWTHPFLKAICLAPSRELARQIMSVVVAMGKFTPVQTEYAIKDNLPRNVSRITAHVVVGTPGTMTDLMRRKVIDVSEVKVFVLDEADNMLDQDGLGDQTLRVKKYAPFLVSFLTRPDLCTACYRDRNRRSFSFLRRSPITSVHSQTSSLRAQIRSNSRRRNCLLMVFDNSTWIAETRSINTIYSCPCIPCLRSVKVSFSARSVLF